MLACIANGIGRCLMIVVMRHTSDSADFETGADLGRQFALGPAQHNVQELLLSRNWGNVLPRGLHGGQFLIEERCLW